MARLTTPYIPFKAKQTNDTDHLHESTGLTLNGVRSGQTGFTAVIFPRTLQTTQPITRRGMTNGNQLGNVSHAYSEMLGLVRHQTVKPLAQNKYQKRYNHLTGNTNVVRL